MEAYQDKPARWTVKDVLQWTTDYFRKKDMETPRLDAEVLLAHALKVDRLRLYLDLERPLTPQERTVYRDLIRRRASREPVALIIGVKEFWSLPFKVTRGVLIPRPDTERLVEVVLDEIREKPAPFILEIGTGSGAVAVAIVKECPMAKLVATDLSRVAIAVAAANAETAGLRGSIEFVVADLLEPFAKAAKFDVICSNPPYIPSDVIPTLAPEITCFEPRTALDGGPDGLEVIRRLVDQTPLFLKEGGTLIIEVGEHQAEAVREIMSRTGHFTDIQFFSDLTGKSRVVKARLISSGVQTSDSA